jgi:glucokinase-like ROK family protein
VVHGDRVKATIADLQLVRQINRATILDCVRRHGPISRTDLARITTLTPATTFAIVEELVGMGLLLADGFGSSRGGRRPVLFRFNPSAFFAVGVNIGGLGCIVAVLTDLDGRIRARVSVELAVGEPPAQVIGKIVASARQVIRAAQVDQALIRGAGIAVPGLVDVARGTLLYSTNLDWQDVAIAAPVSDALQLPVYVENNARAMALGENWCGAGRDYQNIVCINVGVGIGAGIVLGGKLYRGRTSSAGEIGHTTIDEDGPLCRCGNRGCLEALAAGPAIAKRAALAMRRGAQTSIAQMLDGDLDAVTAELVAEAALAGDSLAIQLLKEAGSYLGIGVASLINLLNPDAVIIGGGVAQAGEAFLSAIRSAVAIRALDPAAAQTPIVSGALGLDASSIGAATLLLEHGLAC